MAEGTDNDKSKKNNEQDSEEAIRERLKQRKEARRRQSNEESKPGEEKPAAAGGNSSHKRRRRGRRNRHHRRDGNHVRGGGPPPPQEWRLPPQEWRGRGPPPPPPHLRNQPLPPPRGGDWRGPPPQPHPWGRRPPGGRDWGRGGPPPPPRYHRRSRSRSRSHSRSRSSRSRSYSSDSSYDSRSRSRSYSTGRSYSSRSRSSSFSSDDDSDASSAKKTPGDALTKDQRTVFLSQLVMRTTERDINKFFKKQLKCKVNEVILLRDKRTSRHKGCAYVELSHLQDVHKAVAASGQAPDFQRFPILIKASEAEKNYNAAIATTTTTIATGPMVGPDGKLYEAQKVYVGNLDPSVTAQHLEAIFAHFGQMEKPSLQIDVTTGLPRGFIFLAYKDPKSANLAIQAMAGQVLAGRVLKTGWASQTSSVPGVEIKTSDEFPLDAAQRIQNAQVALAQLQAGTGLAIAPAAVAVVAPGAVSSVAEAAINAALGLPVGAAAAATGAAVPATTTAAIPAVAATTTPTAVTTSTTPAAPVTTTPDDDAKKVSGTPSRQILVHNMFDKDEETEEGWQEDIRLDFEEECSKYGKIEVIKVMADEPGGRWFDKRQLRVEYVESVPE